MDSPQQQPQPSRSQGRDRFFVTTATGEVRLTVELPGVLDRAQADVWRALRAGLVAADLVAATICITVLANGDLVGSCTSAYQGWSSDPLIDAHAETVANVAEAAMETFGYVHEAE